MAWNIGQRMQKSFRLISTQTALALLKKCQLASSRMPQKQRMEFWTACQRQQAMMVVPNARQRSPRKNHVGRNNLAQWIMRTTIQAQHGTSVHAQTNQTG